MASPGSQCGLCDPYVYIAIGMSKIPFSRDSQIHEIQARRSHFVSFEPIESLEISTPPGQIWSLESVFVGEMKY